MERRAARPLDAGLARLDPAALRHHLSIIWAWRYDPERATLVGRLAGQTIVDAVGLQIRGRAIEECFPLESAPVIRERFARVMAGPRLMRSAGRVYVTSRRHGSGERISLPLADDGVSCDGIIGATVYTFDRPVGQDEKIENDEREEAIEFFEFLA